MRTNLLALGSAELCAALNRILDKDTRTDETELRRLVLLMVPLMRRIAFASGQLGDKPAGIPIKQLRNYYEWLESTDPLAARMLDLRYFGKLSVKAVAELVALAPHVVLRELRRHKEALRLCC